MFYILPRYHNITLIHSYIPKVRHYYIESYIHKYNYRLMIGDIVYFSLNVTGSGHGPERQIG